MNEIYNLNSLADDIMGRLKAAGADKASCYLSCWETHEFNYDCGDFSLFRTLFGTSLSVTAIKGGKRGSARINRLDDDAIEGAVADCLASAEASEPDEAWDIAPEIKNGQFTDGVIEPDIERFFDRTRELIDDISRLFPKIVVEGLTTAYMAGHVVYANTNGVRFDTRTGYYSISPTYSAHDGDNATSFFYSYALLTELDKPLIEAASLKNDLADTVRQLDSRTLDGKFTGTIILTPACLCDFLSSICGNFVGSGKILDGTSVWRDKLGKQVADSRLTLKIQCDDERIAAPDHYTSDGFPSENYNLIENGILQRFMLSLYVANKTGFERAPNDGGSFVIEAGDTPLEDIVATVDRGLIVGRFSGGAPATNGEFSGVAKNSFFIENGKVTKAATETMISGNLADILMNIRGISTETVCDGTSYLPYIAFDGVTVSGKS